MPATNDAETVILEDSSSLTDRYQTTVPAAVRAALKLGKKSKLKYTLRGNGEVVISRIDQDQEAGGDPSLAGFLSLLERDIATRPERLASLSHEHVSRIQSLVHGVDVDLDAPLPDDNDA